MRRRWLHSWCADRPRRLVATLLLLGAAGVVGNGALDLRSAEAAVPTHMHMGMYEGMKASKAGDLQKITSQIMCQCGCNLTVSACEGTMVCDISKRMKQEALGLLDKGKSVKAVLASFQSDYGEQVLGAPTKKGFNLTAWLLPFAALAIGASVIGVALLRWRRRPVPVPLPVSTPDPAYMARVEEEVNRDQ